MTAESRTPAAKPGHTALRFVLLLGVVSLFADFAYEGSRSVLGPYLAMLGASAFVVGTVTGFGELAGYGLRLFSGPIADRTGRYWPITLLGYAIQMIAVPALAFTHSWPAAAALIVAERAGRAIRNPPKDAMLSHAGKQAGGVGWAFGLNEALDQTGAMVGPLVMAAVLALRHDYHLAFAVLAFPAAITLVLMVTARLLYPRPQDLEHKSSVPSPKGLPRAFWIYMAGAALAGAGLADYPLIAYHFVRANVVPGAWIAVFYSVAMATSGAGSLLFGHLFDRFGFRVLIAASLIAALFAPLVFLGGFWMALVGAAVWGVATGVFESIIPAAVTPMVAPERRASAFGLFTAVYGTAWFAGSALIGFLYDRSLSAVIGFCVVGELAAIPFFIWAVRSGRKPNGVLH